MKASGIEVELIWIPAHKGIQENELADSKAKEAVTVGRDSQIGFSAEEFRPLWREKLFFWFTEWCNDTGKDKGVAYFKYIHKPKRKPWLHKINLGRKGIASLCHLRSNHWPLRESLFRFNIVESPLCLTCGTPESASHILWQCSIFKTERTFLIKSLVKLIGFFPCSIEALFALHDDNILFILGNFFTSININC